MPDLRDPEHFEVDAALEAIEHEDARQKEALRLYLMRRQMKFTRLKEILSRPYWFLRWIWEELGVVKGRTWTRFSLTTGECIKLALSIFAGALAVGLFVFLALLLDGPH